MVIQLEKGRFEFKFFYFNYFFYRVIDVRFYGGEFKDKLGIDFLRSIQFI